MIGRLLNANSVSTSFKLQVLYGIRMNNYPPEPVEAAGDCCQQQHCDRTCDGGGGGCHMGSCERKMSEHQHSCKGQL